MMRQSDMIKRVVRDVKADLLHRVAGRVGI